MLDTPSQNQILLGIPTIHPNNTENKNFDREYSKVLGVDVIGAGTSVRGYKLSFSTSFTY